MKAKTLLLIFIIFTRVISYCQIRQNGLIYPKDFTDSDICCIYSPPEGFSVFDKPNGGMIGTLTRNAKSNTSSEPEYKIYFVDYETNIETRIEAQNFKETGYEEFSITYFERRDGFVRIVNESVNYWLSENEITDKNFKVIDWQQFYTIRSGQVMGFYANEPGIELKLKPTNDSESLILLKGDLFEITPSTETIGNWTKVKVKKYKEHPCVSGLDDKDIVEYELEGWIEVIDEKDQPKLWFYARGC